MSGRFEAGLRVLPVFAGAACCLVILEFVAAVKTLDFPGECGRCCAHTLRLPLPSRGDTTAAALFCCHVAFRCSLFQIPRTEVKSRVALRRQCVVLLLSADVSMLTVSLKLSDGPPVVSAGGGVSETQANKVTPPPPLIINKQVTS